jgi:mannose-6-phosphate isomerase-like protein (cupin superfamily)
MESRPWGYFSVLWKGGEYLVKLVSVDPGKRLSLQFHRDRSEYWIIVEGSALVTLGGSDFYLSRGGMLVIAQGVSHRIANVGESVLRFIEVWIGDCSEEDIVRVEDDYGRV